MSIPRGPLLLALGVTLFFDLLRVFLPSLITLFGRAGETPPELMGLYAAVWFVLPFLAVLLRPRWALLGGAVLLVVARLLLQAGVGQLYVASAGVTAALVFLYGCARTMPRAWVAPGIMGGLALSFVVHFLLDGVDLVWRDGPLPWLAGVAVCAAFLALTWLYRPAPGEPAPWSVWLLAGPVMLLAGMSATGQRPSGSPELEWLFTAPVVMALVFAPYQATRPPRSAWSAIGFAALLLAGFLHPVFLVIGASALLAVPGRTARRPGAAMLSGGLIFFAGLFLYYAAYDLNLGFPNVLVPAVVAVTIAGVSLSGYFRNPPPRYDLGAIWPVFAVAAAVALLVSATTFQTAPAASAKQGGTLRLIAYNIRMGFGLDGRLSLDRIAAWAAAQRPDVVLLSEVDRGWLLNGGHDDLSRIARPLGMRYYFAPAADPLWGDAILTNLPTKSLNSTPLGRHDYPTGAQAQTMVVEVGGRELAIVNTHLQAPAGQAPEVAELAELAGKLIAQGRPVVLAGDLNLRPGDPGMRVLEQAGLSDPLIAKGDPPTSPADAPKERIDHVLTSANVILDAVAVPSLDYSDHLPVVADLRITDASR
ncbi:endonuclease/exonuclease/phosphatase family protein [Nonomuraea typhae]|uniref:endonuclease/exonuclease/phosphatase family protein n=1 Tax=Nonomuraea typhae TaxID=2603600 RepID=UPI0012F763A7|nr:endonuclease/exonuclease/phosphatase family protein [Nonomuraea typhae]